MLVLHFGEDPAIKEQSFIYLADIIKGKGKKMITIDFNSCYFEMSLTLNFTEVSLCFCGWAIFFVCFDCQDYVLKCFF